MGSRDRQKSFGRKENVRAERQSNVKRDLLTFNFKHLDQTQPATAPQTLNEWQNEGLLESLITRLQQLSELTRDEALTQQQIKIYNDFPPADKTEFAHPPHVGANACWAVIKSIGGQKGVVAGFIEESTFYAVFLDKNHRFWISEKKHT